MSTEVKRSAIVTGASRGIGRAIAIRLAQDGFDVAVGYGGSRELAEQVVAEIQAKGGSAIAVQGDVSNPSDVDQIFDTTLRAFGRLDAVVSNAGVLSMVPIKAENIDEFDRIMSVNTRGTFLMMGKAAEVLGEGGRIVTLSTSASARSNPGYGPYIASKLAVEGLVRVLANELRGRKITVNAVAPGAVTTELFFDGKSEEQIAAIAKMPPLERLGEPDDVANVVSFLVSEGGGWVNAQVIRANGGFA
jgi:Dehydrogenases with different specificities (related to short-chain alcohol dehydrogenases)